MADQEGLVRNHFCLWVWFYLGFYLLLLIKVTVNGVIRNILPIFCNSDICFMLLETKQTPFPDVEGRVQCLPQFSVQGEQSSDILRVHQWLSIVGSFVSQGMFGSVWRCWFSYPVVEWGATDLASRGQGWCINILECIG